MMIWKGEFSMINGAHIVVHTSDPDADRAFFRNFRGFPSVDAGRGWLIFGLPPAEAAFHPAESNRHEFYLMCDNLKTEIAALHAKSSPRSGYRAADRSAYTNPRTRDRNGPTVIPTSIPSLRDLYTVQLRESRGPDATQECRAESRSLRSGNP